jgi:hypothetical protein
MIETELPELLQDASADAPPSRLIDLGKARVDGARTVRRRRTGLALTAAVTALALVFAVAWVGVGRRHATAPVAVGSKSPATEADPTRFDPLRLRIAAGWVPEGNWNVSTETRRDLQSVLYDQRDRPGVPEVAINVYAVGAYPVRGQVRPTGGVPGPAIHGSSSTWYAQSKALVWQWAPGAWATVSLVGNIGPAPLDVASHVATALRTDVDLPVSAPVTMAAPPAPLYLIQVDVNRYIDGSFDAQLVFSDSDGASIVYRNSNPFVLVYVTPNAGLTGPAGLGPPNTQINGRPAIDKPYPAGDGRVLLMGLNGTWVDVGVVDATATTQSRQSLAETVARAIEPVSDPSDPSTWTATPIR